MKNALSETLIPLLKKGKEPSKTKFFLLLFGLCVIARLSTLFIDFYDIDELSAIVQTKEWLAGFIKDVDFAESKLPLYHAIFKLAYYLLPTYGWIAVHAITIVFIFATSVFLYLMGSRVSGGKCGMTAAILYGVLISSFNRHFMATNGEIIYNLPITAGAYFFVSAVTSEEIRSKTLRFMFSIVSLAAAMEVKFHGVILLIYMAFFLFVYMPYIRGFLKKAFLVYIIIAAATAAAVFIGYSSGNGFITEQVFSVKNKLFYATEGRSGSILYFIGIYLFRQGMLVLWHLIIWVPGFVLMWKFVRSGFRLKNVEASAYMILFILTLLMVFGGGSRMYYHYFMAAYPALCIIAALSIESVSVRAVLFVKRNALRLLLIPAIFFFGWNMKDVFIRYAAPSLFYNESSAAFWFRAVVVSSMNDYLLPNGSYAATVEYVRKHTTSKDTIFVWGDGPQLYYFADRRIAIKHVWPRNTIIRIIDAYKDNSPESIEFARANEQEFIDRINLKKAELFIDTSPKGLHVSVTKWGDFAKFPYDVTPLIREFLKKNYRLEAEVDGFRIYRRKK
jgi:hypothetical protein